MVRDSIYDFRFMVVMRHSYADRVEHTLKRDTISDAIYEEQNMDKESFKASSLSPALFKND